MYSKDTVESYATMPAILACWCSDHSSVVPLMTPEQGPEAQIASVQKRQQSEGYKSHTKIVPGRASTSTNNVQGTIVQPQHNQIVEGCAKTLPTK